MFMFVLNIVGYQSSRGLGTNLLKVRTKLDETTTTIATKHPINLHI